MMNSRTSIMRSSNIRGSIYSKKNTNRTSMFNHKKDNRRLIKFEKKLQSSVIKKIKKTTSLPTLTQLRAANDLNHNKISKLAGSSNLKNFFRFTRRPRSRERKFWYRSWSSSPQKASKTIYKKLPGFEYEVPEMPKKVISYMANLASRSSFVAFTGVEIHKHDHRKTPHVHHPRMCGDVRAISGYDKNRQNRFYFTKNKTPVRVYFNYDSNLSNINNLINQIGANIANNNKRITNDRISSSLVRVAPQLLTKKLSNKDEDQENDLDENLNSKVNKKSDSKILKIMCNNEPVLLNGRKLSANSLKNTKISSRFMEEAKNYLYSNESLSFFPPVEVKEYVKSSLTLAEMAVLPLNQQEDHHSHHSQSHNQHHISHSKTSIAPHAKESQAQVKHSIMKNHPSKQSTISLHESSRPLARSDVLNEISEDD